jgi:hypothetical protein
MSGRQFSNACLASSLALLGLTFSSPARASDGGFVLDARGGYPWVHSGGPGDSEYFGVFTFGVRSGVVTKHFEMLGSVDRYWLGNRVGEDSVRAGMTVASVLMAYRLGLHRTGRWFDLVFGGTIGGATRFFDGIDGTAGSFTASAVVMMPFYPGRGFNFYFAPELEWLYVGESSGSNIGEIGLIVLGLRVGFDTADARASSAYSE